MLQDSRIANANSTSSCTLLPVSITSTAFPTSSVRFNFTSHPTLSANGFFSREIDRMYPDVMRSLIKWGFDANHMTIQRFSFDHSVGDYLLTSLIRQFLTHPNVLQELKVVSSESDEWTFMGQVESNSIVLDQLSTEYTDLSLFDCLFDKGVIREDGTIRSCIETKLTCSPVCFGITNPSPPYEAYPRSSFSPEILVSDELRTAFLDETADNFILFPPDSLRKEVLFHILAHLVIGGRVNQFEDNVGPYFDATKALSRTFLRVGKTKEETIFIRSIVFRVSYLQSTLAPLFPSPHPQNFLLLFVDPIARQIVTWYHASPSYYL